LACFGLRRFDAALVWTSSCCWPDQKTKNQSGVKKRRSEYKTKAASKRRSPKGDDVDDMRLRLIERLCRLPQAHLADVEALFASLEGKPLDTATPEEYDRPARFPQGPHKDWPHAPVHRLGEHGTFIVTASTVRKNHFFRGEEKLTLLEHQLLLLAKQHGIVLEAWAVFSNHYHFVAHTTGAENQLANLIAQLHSATAKEINRRDGSSGRQVWFNYWDTQLTFEKSYLARLSYVHHNAVKHGLVRQANEYRWCSATWFERTATPAQRKTIFGFKTDRVKVDDDYDPVV
jgi:putative transposase